jgi:N utilization substance protein B
LATRHQTREFVVGLLYAYELGNTSTSSIIDTMLEERKIRNQQKEFAKELFFGVLDNIEKIDEEIHLQIKNWDFDRVGTIEKSILRVGVYEIFFSDIDKAVIINEAIEITKTIGSDNSPRFINGVLDSVQRPTL